MTRLSSAGRRTAPDHRGARVAARFGAGALIAAVALIAAPQASATQGSVPPEIVEYTTDPDGLLFRLNDVYGVGGNGQGIDFDETTKAGPLYRVFVWTDEFVAGEQTETPVRRLNEWITTISINEKPVGIATIWINDSSLLPELASFERGVALSGIFVDLPQEATLIRDDERGAWLTLIDTTVNPIEPGTSGLSAPTTLNAYRNVLSSRGEPILATPRADEGLRIGLFTIGGLLAVIAVALLIPGRRRTPAVQDEGPMPEQPPADPPKSGA